MPKKFSDADEIERTKKARWAQRQLDHQVRYLSMLRQSRRATENLGNRADPRIDELIKEGEALRFRLAGLSGMRMAHRKRATAHRHDPTHDCVVFLDECGAPSLNASDIFPVFTLAAVITTAEHYDRNLDLQWRVWKGTNLGDQDYPVHEPEVRGRSGRFGDELSSEVLGALGEFLHVADFSLAACTIHRAELRAQLDPERLDETLPDQIYLMAMDFIFERIVQHLDICYPGGKAMVIAESRGPKEDALLQYEFARLHLDGTSYIGDSFFRRRLHPGISFRSKSEHCTGLQLADLCLKVFPWHERYEGLEKS
jgi:hypothetical protein